MQKKNILRFVLVSLLLTGSFLVLRSTTPGSKTEPACTIKKTQEGCSVKEPEGLLWENFSRQFISSIILQP